MTATATASIVATDARASMPIAREAVALLFTDIVDSTAQLERPGDDAWLGVLRRHHTLVRSHVALHGGAVVNTAGDGFMIAFGDPRAAVACAVALQRSLAAPDPDLGAPLRVRMGLHFGEAISFAGDFHGRTVVLAARVGARAGAEEILVSEAVVRSVAHSMRGRLTRLGDVALKGLAGRHAIYALDWKPRAYADHGAAIAPPATG